MNIDKIYEKLQKELYRIDEDWMYYKTFTDYDKGILDGKEQGIRIAMELLQQIKI